MQTQLLTTIFGWQAASKFERILKYSIGVCLLVLLFGGVAVAADSFGDPFEKGKLQNPNWKWQNEPPKWDVGDTRENFLYIDSEPNRNLWANDMSHFLYQETDTDMFDVETHFFAKWDTSSGVNGLVVKSPKDDNWVTIKFWSRDEGAKGHIQYQTKQAGMGPPDIQWRFGDWGDIEMSLRLKKEGDTYTAWYKAAEDKDWMDIGQGDFELTPPLWLGIYAGVAAGAGNLEVEYEYFNDNLNPFPVEPGGKATTLGGSKSSVLRMDNVMQYRLIIFLTFFGVSTLAASTFTDVSRTANVYQRETPVDAESGAWFGPGTAAVDYDNDGCWLDIFVVGDGGLPNALYHNNGDGTFTDVAVKAGVANTPRGRGCVWFDYNNDGWRDLYVTCAGPNYLYHNNGDGTFTDVTQQAGVGDEKHGTGPVIADYDHDGWLDIYIANWGRAPSLLNPNPAPKTNVLYRNRGDGTFEEVTKTAGVEDDGIAWGAIFFDYDGDTWADLFVANDHGPDKLYHNRGDGTFADVSEQSGIVTEVNGKPTGAMGLCVGDYDNDADLDFFITNYDADLLWRNNGDGTFTNVAETVGVANEGVGWYASFVDYDNDGFRDLYVVNGDVDGSQKTNRNRLYHNQNGQFVDRADALNATVDAVARGATAGDFDNDNDVDFYVVSNTGNTLLQNDLDPGFPRSNHRRVQPKNRRIKIKLIGTESNRDGIGTRVTVTVGNLVQTQELICGTGFLGSDSLELEFGLAAGYGPGSITLAWPSGIVETYQFGYGGDVYIFTEAGDVVTAVEPTGKQSTIWGKVKAAEVFQNYPNPFNPETWIPYQLFESTDVHISIYSQNGELIRDFNLGHQPHGKKVLYWDGKNRDGETVASGIYFYQFKAGDTQSVRKMWLLK